MNVPGHFFKTGYHNPTVLTALEIEAVQNMLGCEEVTAAIIVLINAIMYHPGKKEK